MNRLIVGVDEAGRGPLAGDVVAAAVILGECPLHGITDSKKLSAARREQLAERIMSQASDWAVGRCSPREIDRLNILQGTFLAMQRAVAGLKCSPDEVLVDGNRVPDWPYPSRAIVGGDASEACIAAASIIAKVTRDKAMVAADALYPGYGFAQHKGYPTKAHREALIALGPCPLHRLSFGPVRAVLTS